jgi:hypothetical protein
MEDDASFSLYPFWNTNLEQIMDNAPKDWHIITLFDFNCRNTKGDYMKFNVRNPCCSTVAYIINRKGMENILREILDKNEIILDPKDNISCNHMVSDFYIYHRAKSLVLAITRLLNHPNHSFGLNP